MTKRQFLVGTGSVLVVLPAGWTFSGCDDDDEQEDITLPVDAAVDGPPAVDAAPGPAADAEPALPFLRFTSSVDVGHMHTVTLEVSTIAAPPSAGVIRETSIDDQHLHTVTLTEQELRAIDAGETVTKTTSVVAAHVHTFAFSRAAGIPVPMG
jgi:hypothetical protein